MSDRSRLLALIWVSALSCRTPLIGVAPILPRVIEDLHLSRTVGGLLFSLPVLMMGLLGVPGGLLADRFGAGRMIGAGLLAVAVAGAMRSLDGVVLFFVATGLVGAAIGVLQPAMPRVVRERFADRVGFATAVYSTGFTGGSLIAVLVTSAWLVPALGRFGWRGTFTVWSALAAVTALAWWPFRNVGARGAGSLDLAAVKAIVGDRLLARVAVALMCNSAAFYATNAWLTAYYESLGTPPARAAGPLALATGVGAACGFLAPILTDRLRARRGVFVAGCAFGVAGAAGLLVAPGTAGWLWSSLFGAGLFASFTVALVIPVDVSPPARVGTATGIVFAAGHGGGLVGPLLSGFLSDLTGSFGAAIASILALCVVMTAVALTIPETYGRGAKQERAGRRAGACG